MNVTFDVTSSDSAYDFLLDTLGLKPDELIMEYLVECDGDVDLFVEKNEYRLEDLCLQDVHFIGFHVTASLDDCNEIKANGIRDLQYVLSHDTMLSRFLKLGGIQFDIENCLMYINGQRFDIDFENFRRKILLSPKEELLDPIAHRIYYDFCLDGYWASDNVEGYGTDIHKRPEFISKLIKIPPKANSLDAYWRSKSKPYKIFFYATLDQIHKFTFGLEKNTDAYNEDEQKAVKRWMMRVAMQQAFEPRGDLYIYIADHQHIPVEQIIKYEVRDTD